VKDIIDIIIPPKEEKEIEKEEDKTEKEIEKEEEKEEKEIEKEEEKEEKEIEKEEDKEEKEIEKEEKEIEKEEKEDQYGIGDVVKKIIERIGPSRASSGGSSGKKSKNRQLEKDKKEESKQQAKEDKVKDGKLQEKEDTNQEKEHKTEGGKGQEKKEDKQIKQEKATPQQTKSQGGRITALVNKAFRQKAEIDVVEADYVFTLPVVEVSYQIVNAMSDGGQGEAEPIFTLPIIAISHNVITTLDTPILQKLQKEDVGGVIISQKTKSKLLSIPVIGIPYVIIYHIPGEDKCRNSGKYISSLFCQ
jgi:hypothetical protein